MTAPFIKRLVRDVNGKKYYILRKVSPYARNLTDSEPLHPQALSYNSSHSSSISLIAQKNNNIKNLKMARTEDNFVVEDKAMPTPDEEVKPLPEDVDEDKIDDAVSKDPELRGSTLSLEDCKKPWQHS